MLNDIVEVYNYISAFTANNTLRVVTPFTATASQTTFSASYTPGFIDVFYNGSKLAASEYTASNGVSITLGTAAQLNDIVEVTAYSYTVGAFTGIGGSGTANYIAKFTSGSTVGTSSIYDSGSNVGINTINPIYTLDVSGSARFTNTATITGSLNVSGSNTLIGTKTITGSVFISGSKTIIGTNTITGSLNVSGSSTIIGATVLSGSLTVSGSITSNGTLTAQTLVVQTITSSVLYSSGSNVFGNALANTQQFTGSVGITGSLTLNNIAVPTSASLASTYLPLTGGTLTGALGGTSATFSGTINSTITNALVLYNNTSTTQYVYTSLANSVGNARYGVDNSSGGGLGTGTSANSAVFGNAGNADVDITTNNISRLRIASTGAATFSSSVSAATTFLSGIRSNTISPDNGITNNYQGYGGYWALRTDTSNRFNLDVYNSGTPISALQLSLAGAATFASSVSVGGYLTGNGVNPGGLGGSRYIIDWSGGYSRVFSMGVNASTNGGIILNSQRSDGTNSIDALTIAPSGAATFSSQVSIGTTTTGQYPLLLKAASGDVLIYGISSNGTYAFDSYEDGSSGQLHIRNGSCDVYLPRTAGTWVGNSDKTIKENIELIPDALNKIMQLNGYTYNLIDDKENNLVGVIAQEVQQVLPQAVHKSFSKNYNREILGVEYDVLIPLLINAIKELSAKNESLQSQINELKNN
jgi:hypothetical protein